MATPIRPSALPFVPTRPQVAGDTARAAQRAFFSQALNGVQAEVSVGEVTPVAPVKRQAAPERVDIPAEQPAPTVRPGSYLDIKV